jgi:hypothetical protein
MAMHAPKPSYPLNDVLSLVKWAFTYPMDGTVMTDVLSATFEA